MGILGVPYSDPINTLIQSSGVSASRTARSDCAAGARWAQENTALSLFITLHKKMLRLAGQGHSFHCIKWEAQGWERCEFLVQVPTARAEIKSRIAYPHSQCYFYYRTVTTWFSRYATDASSLLLTLHEAKVQNGSSGLPELYFLLHVLPLGGPGELRGLLHFPYQPAGKHFLTPNKIDVLN